MGQRDGLFGASRLTLRVAVARPPALNLACGQVVEPSCFLSAVRISADSSGKAVGVNWDFFENRLPGTEPKSARKRREF